MTQITPEWWATAKQMREGMCSIPQIAAACNVSQDVVRSALGKMGVKWTRPPEPAWRAEARKLMDERLTGPEISRRLGVSYTSVKKVMRGESAPREYVSAPGAVNGFRHNVTMLETYADRKKARPAPVRKAIAGEVNPEWMDAARAYARGEIDRHEMMTRIGKRPMRGAYA